MPEIQCMTYKRSELQAIDALVTKFVMDYPSYDQDDITASINGEPSLVPVSTNVSNLQPPPPWSTDIELALSIVSYLTQEGFRCKFEGGKDGWTVTFLFGTTMIVEHKAYAHKLSLAICLASLFTVGINPFKAPEQI